MVANTVFSTDLVHHDSKFSQEIKDIVWGVMEEIGRLNVADYFPVFRLLDPQGIRRAMKIYFSKLSDIFYGIIDQRLKSEASSVASNDVLDALLNLTKEDNHEWSFSDTIHLLLNEFKIYIHFLLTSLNFKLVFSKSYGTNFWNSRNGLFHILGHVFGGDRHNVQHSGVGNGRVDKQPKNNGKARRELQEVLGKDGIVQESDISKLPYLQSVVKETLRLHPPGPLLLPHKAQADVEICGFTVPKNSQVLVNAWAIGRDPNTWTNPNAFVPERFQGSEIDVKGRDFEVIPFGSGRRMCPGMPLAHRMVHLMLASLLHSFDWKLEDGLKPEDMDMSEKFGITLQKAKPLRAIPIRI
ncbi:Geraniol 8-hydroxylase [Vitis vinifera]|uniref:Geraniol 8-hydroxylase n=1 Tax=Vitis vinifera TaxID=29760 RepID=A0A438E0D9_VITVI|nr:Geraniol 8-hydroxylase [Vitis vinifera]